LGLIDNVLQRVSEPTLYPRIPAGSEGKLISPPPTQVGCLCQTSGCRYPPGKRAFSGSPGKRQRRLSFLCLRYEKENDMFIKRIVIGDGERGLLFRNRRLESVLMPGVYRHPDLLRRIRVEIFSVDELVYNGPHVEVLIERLGEQLTDYFILADIKVDEVGLLMVNGKLEEVLSPGSRALYWKGSREIVVETLALADDLEVPTAVARRLRQIGGLNRVAVSSEVPAESAGLLIIDGCLVRRLAPGRHAFWNFQGNVQVEVIDLRVQSLEVSGQELLTRDKVSLRVNLAASIRVTDPVVARSRVVRYADFVYRELQYGLRKAVSSKSLDELLGDKASLDADIYAYVRGRVTDLGIEIQSVGVKDVILPGEMRDILNSVVQAEKAAQANVIRRREEANATRSLANTARLLEDNPTLLRLKELESLEKVTEKVERLTVFGGLEGVMSELVKLRGN
jgi:regulator of protease activity HflC (stomatin/prohibitin superfamily)